jgi:hypothetical protein
LVGPGDPEARDLNGRTAILYERHGRLRCKGCGGRAEHPKLKPESTCANGDGIARDLLALFGATEDIDQIDPLANWE